MVKVSVIIPVYNVENYLRQCLDSVVNQTLREIEIICVNDSSTDGSLAILEEYARKDARIKVITQPNAGAGAARNRGMDAAGGKYLSFLDADDFFEPVMLEHAYEAAEQNRADFVVYKSDQYHTEENKYVPVSWAVREQELPPYPVFNYRQMTDNVFKVFVGWAWDKLFSREFVLRHQLRYQEQRTSNDMLFVFSAVVLAERISLLPEVLVHQRRDSKDSLSKTRENSWWCFHDALSALRDRLQKEGLYSELEKDFINYALHFTLWNYNTLAEPTRTTLKEKLESEWLEELGIAGKSADYFYNQKEYDQYEDIFGLKRMETESGDTLKRLVPVPQPKTPVPAPMKKETPAPGGVKQVLRRFVPTSRTYADKKFKDLTGTMKKQFQAQNKVLKEQGKELCEQNQRIGKQDELIKKQVELLDKQRKELDNQKKMIENQKKLLEELRRNDKEQLKAIAGLKQFVDQELKRRDGWGAKAAEVNRLAGERPVWVIKCPAPEDASKIRWGDYPFALTLKRELEKRGVFVLVDTREDWGCEAGADVVLVLRGCLSYRPDRRNAKCLYVMWNISHPDMVTKEEYELYDVVCVGSRHYAKKLKEELAIPVFPLLQCTDTELFYPSKEEQTDFKWDYIFIGNSRGVARNCVMWAVEDQLPLRMWGSGWNTILKDHMDLFEAPFIENSQIPELYRSAKVTLNDHWEDMREKQFVNNRIFDALACGLPVITDTCEELRELFPDAVLHYETKEEFEECVRKIQRDYPAIRKKVLEQWPLIQREYSFGARAEQLMEIVGQLKK